MLRYGHLITFLLALCLIPVLVGCSDDDSLDGDGIIIIDPFPDTIDAPWTLTRDEDKFSLSGSGDTTLDGLGDGEYTVTWGAVTNWIAPDDSTQTLDADETIIFTGTYVTPYIEATLVAEIGTGGSDQGEFEEVADIAVDPDGNLYVCDFGNDRVQKFTSSRAFSLEFDHDNALDIEVDQDGDVYVWGNSELYKYDGTGTLISDFNRLNYSTYTSTADNHFAVSPVDDELACVNMSGSVSVWDSGASSYSVVGTDRFSVLRIQKSDGGYLSHFGSSGSDDGEFTQPYTTAFDQSGLLYVIDVVAENLQIFDAGVHVETRTSDVIAGANNGFAIDVENRLYYRNGQTITVYSNDGAISDAFTVSYDNHSVTMPKYIATWHDDDADEDYLYSSSGYSVFVYRLEFVGW